MLRQLRSGLVLAVVVFCACALAAVASAAPTGAITPYIHCTDGVETVPAGQLIVIRTSWVTSSAGLSSIFIKNQMIEWTLHGTSSEQADILATSGPQFFGSLMFWTDVGQVDRSLDGGKAKKVYESLYNGQTAVGLRAGQAVRLEYTFTVNRDLRDGLGPDTPKGTVYSTSSCLITAV